MTDILGIGCCAFDFLVLLDHFPQEDSKGNGGISKVQCGGPCAVAMIAASKLGVSSAFESVVGDDLFGQTIREKLNGYGVDTSGVQVIPGGASVSCAVLSNSVTASRTCVGGSQADLPVLRPEQVDLEMLRQAKYLHVDGTHLEAARYAAEKAREFGVKVSMDVERVRTEHMLELLDFVDILIPSEKFAYTQTGTEDVEEAARILWKRYRPEVLVVTQGPKGGVIVYQDRLTRYEAFRVEAIDSNGAGDVFHGAWLAAAVRGMDPYEATRFAAAASAIKCTHFGASEGAPDFEQVQEFLKAQEDK